MSSITLQVRGIDPNIKNQADAIFKQLGVSASAAIKMFINQVAVTGKIPFTPTTVDENGFTPEAQKRIWDAWNDPEEEVFESMGDLIADLKKNHYAS